MYNANHPVFVNGGGGIKPTIICCVQSSYIEFNIGNRA